jgi:hypothetical protein
MMYRKGQFKKGNPIGKETRFTRGHTVYNKGTKGLIKHSEKTRKKMSENYKYHVPKNSFKKGHIPWCKGIKGLIKPNKGSFKIGQNTGNEHPLWKGGITPLMTSIRHSFKYRQWISDVFTRDNYTCQECNKRGGTLNAHHIKEFSKIIEENKITALEQALNCEELWNINNGKTLCEKCHNKTKGKRWG